MNNHLGRVCTFIVGVGLIAGAFVAPQGGDPFATMALWLGAALVLAAGITPWIAELAVGPQGVTFKSRGSPEESTRISATSEPLSIDESSALAEPEILDRARLIAAEAALEGLLWPATGPLAHKELYLYLWDEDEEKLIPIFGGSEAQQWKLGQGATGEAFALGKYVGVEGEDVHNETHGLTTEQQELYQDLTAVAAMPVLNGSGKPIAVVSAASVELDDPLLTPAAYEQQAAIAAAVARVLIDLLSWEDD